MKYFIIELTCISDHYYQSIGDISYHAGGRGNGAFANLYREDQVKRILGQYKNSKRHTAKSSGSNILKRRNK